MQVNWEYKVEFFEVIDSSYLEKLNKLGKEGWELCAKEGGLLMFKRPLEMDADSLNDYIDTIINIIKEKMDFGRIKKFD